MLQAIRLVFLLIVMTSLVFAPLAYGINLYKWIDAKGKVTYQDQPPPSHAVHVEEKEINPEQSVTKFVLPEKTRDATKAEAFPSPPPPRGQRGLTRAQRGAAARAAIDEDPTATGVAPTPAPISPSVPIAPPLPTTPPPPPSVPAGTGGGI